MVTTRMGIAFMSNLIGYVICILCAALILECVALILKIVGYV